MSRRQTYQKLNAFRHQVIVVATAPCASYRLKRQTLARRGPQQDAPPLCRDCYLLCICAGTKSEFRASVQCPVLLLLLLLLVVPSHTLLFLLDMCGAELGLSRALTVASRKIGYGMIVRRHDDGKVMANINKMVFGV